MSTRFRALLQHRWAVLAMTAAGALAAAVATGLIGGWDWAQFWQDVVKNVFLAAIVTAAAAAVNEYQGRERRRKAPAVLLAARDPLLQLIVSGWSDPGAGGFKGRRDPLEPLAADERRQMQAFRAALVLAADCPDPSCPEPGGLREHCAKKRGCLNDDAMRAFLQLVPLRWQLAGYLREGRRRRQRDYLPRLHAELLALEQHLEGGQAEAAARARFQAVRTLGCMDHTDSTILERALVELSTPILTTDPPATWPLFRDAPYLPAAATEHDPCYLLLHHIWHSLPSAERATEAEAEAARQWLGKFRRCLHALQREVDAHLNLIDLILALVPSEEAAAEPSPV